MMTRRALLLNRPYDAAFHVLKNSQERLLALHWHECFRYIYSRHGVRRVKHTDLQMAARHAQHRCDGPNEKGKGADAIEEDDGDDDDVTDADNIVNARDGWKRSVPKIRERQLELNKIDEITAGAGAAPMSPRGPEAGDGMEVDLDESDGDEPGGDVETGIGGGNVGGGGGDDGEDLEAGAHAHSLCIPHP